MAKYVVEMNHRFVVETDDIREVITNYEFPDLHSTKASDWEVLDSSVKYYEEEKENE